jgi:adenylate cyclase
MATETERKFLVQADTWARLAVTGGTELHQGYLSTDPARTVRVRLAPHAAWITIKGRTQGISRPEFEYAIPVEDGRDLLALSVSRVHKTRHRMPWGAHVWDVDVFHGALRGLVLAEVELGADDEAFERPAWLGEEVSADPRYSNSALSVARRVPEPF